jgi:hypothetical protein
MLNNLFHSLAKSFFVFILIIQAVKSGENVEISIDISRKTTISTSTTLPSSPSTIINTTTFILTSPTTTRKIQTLEHTIKPTFLRKLNKPSENQASNSNTFLPSSPTTESTTKSPTSFILVLKEKISKPNRDTTPRETTSTSSNITTELSTEIPKVINQTFPIENMALSLESVPDNIFAVNLPTN